MRKFVKNKLSIIIPTFNEADNVNRLIDEIISEVQNEEYEIIIVDDGSTDDTVNNIFKNFKQNEKIKVIQREHDRGLLQSIKFALQSITGEFFLVMDGDGQHSPRDINLLLDELDKSDLVVGSRDLNNMHSMSKNRISMSKFFNQILSYVLSIKLSDPLTGFFAGKVSILNKKFYLLTNSGFKILLDLIFSNKNKKLKISEKKINFKTRNFGESKLSPQVAFSFITQIISYMFYGLISSKLVGFLIIGALGFVVHFGILIFNLNILDYSFYISHTIATLITASVNFLLNNYLNFYNSKINTFKKIMLSFFKYYLINLPGLLSNIGGATFAYNVLTKNPLISSSIGIILDTMFKYFVSKTWIWKAN